MFFVMLEHFTLSQQVKVCSPCLQRQLSFMPGKPPAAEHWLLQEGDLNLWAKDALTGTSSISIIINENVRSWGRAWSDLWGFSAKWCTYISFFFGHCWKAVQNDVNWETFVVTLEKDWRIFWCSHCTGQHSALADDDTSDLKIIFRKPRNQPL